MLTRCDETITATRDIGEVAGAVAAIAQRLAKIGNVNPKIGFLDGHAGPNTVDQFLPGNDFPCTVGQYYQDIESTAAKRDGLVIS
jgi:hypothetical protein